MGDQRQLRIHDHAGRQRACVYTEHGDSDKGLRITSGMVRVNSHFVVYGLSGFRDHVELQNGATIRISENGSYISLGKDEFRELVDLTSYNATGFIHTMENFGYNNTVNIGMLDSVTLTFTNGILTGVS